MVKGLRFDNLSAEAKERVKDTYRSELDDALDWKVLRIIDDRMKDEGLSSLADVNYSLNECEGDGIAFYGTLNIEEFLKKSKFASGFTMGIDNFSTRFTVGKDAYVTITPEKGTIYHNIRTMVIQPSGVSLDFACAIGDCLKAVIEDLERECYAIMDNEDKVLCELVFNCEFNEDGEEI